MMQRFTYLTIRRSSCAALLGARFDEGVIRRSGIAGIAAAEGELYVADAVQPRVHVFSLRGDYLRAIQLDGLGPAYALCAVVLSRGTCIYLKS